MFFSPFDVFWFVYIVNCEHFFFKVYLQQYRDLQLFLSVKTGTCAFLNCQYRFWNFLSLSKTGISNFIPAKTGSSNCFSCVERERERERGRERERERERIKMHKRLKGFVAVVVVLMGQSQVMCKFLVQFPLTRLRTKWWRYADDETDEKVNTTKNKTKNLRNL